MLETTTRKRTGEQPAFASCTTRAREEVSAAAAAWPVRLVLLRDVACLQRSWWRGGGPRTEAARCDGPAELLVGCSLWSARAYLRECSEFDGCRSASSMGGGLTLLRHSGIPRKLGFLSC
ncbi:uncharacterized protein ACO6RY_06243 [Pungitius sinensis]